MLGEYERELDLATQCTTEVADDLPCRGRIVSALAALGRPDDVPPALDEALAVPARGASVGEVLDDAARELRAHGHRAASLAVARRAVEWWRASLAAGGDATRKEEALLGALLHAEELPEAAELAARLLARDETSPRGIGYSGLVAARRGRREDAERALAELDRLQAPYAAGEREFWRAAITAWLGRSDEATRLLRQAFGAGYSQADVRCHLPLEPLRGYPPFEELTRPRG